MLSEDIIKLMENNSVKSVLEDIDEKRLTIWNIDGKRIIVVDGKLVNNGHTKQIHLSLNDNKAKSIPLSEINYADYFICGISISDIDESYIMCIKCSNYKSLFKKNNKDTTKPSYTTSLSTIKNNIESIFEEAKKGTQIIKIVTSNNCEGHFINLGKDKSKQFEVLMNYFSYIEDSGTKENGDSNMDKKTTKDMIAEEIENKGTKQLVLTGAPGTGKTYSAREYAKEQAIDTYLEENPFTEGLSKDEKEEIYLRYIKFVQFHSSYSYTDFVEGLRPVMLDNQVSFVRMDGVFKEFCRKVVENGDTNHKYFFIIDEINRTDLSKVFGELMFGLEDDYCGEKNKFDTQYKNLPTYSFEKKADGKKEAKEIENDVFADGFYIPENVIIIGTMNDIDRSVEAFDFALRRRFRWINVRANDIMEDSLKGILLRSGEAETGNKGMEESEIKELAQAAKKLNETISEAGESLGLNDDYHIGPAYYKHFTSKTKKASKTKKEEYEEYFNSYLEPILREYVRGRKPEKIEAFITACKTSFSSEPPAAAAQSSEQSNKR